MAERNELTALAPSCWTTDYWLEHCESFQAWSGGVQLGYVETVLTDEGRVHSLLLRVGEVFTNLIAIPAESVIAVDPVSERIEIAGVASVADDQLAIPTV